jgi:hypothetical protein
MSVFFFDDSGAAEASGLAARQGVIIAIPERSATKQVKRKGPEAEGELD